MRVPGQWKNSKGKSASPFFYAFKTLCSGVTTGQQKYRHSQGTDRGLGMAEARVSLDGHGQTQTDTETVFRSMMEEQRIMRSGSGHEQLGTLRKSRRKAW
ncbi:uncharacterized protein SPSK_10669 [Sporothrix schenckii 1099-18]|uniref:Uncharacterized protein n=1 Tax=Sporothrix schenckii 1099-18 TaxID=1397361 RepID=A0A0F2LTT2_SPOSC|nr:uncharacterized protein SPSK_10669 [Sporothrix schenckii 1099-18]KJR80883.1 hypothetical protein SPSK_10669 [Sporothrix schenckii 1099-18]